MNGKNGLDGLVIGKKPVRCQMCRGRLCYVGGGRYRCPLCGREEYDDFGKIRKFLEDNGPAPSIIISQATGVASEVIEAFKEKNFVNSKQVQFIADDRNDKIKKPKMLREEKKSYHLKCTRCGEGISSGRYCTACVNELASGIKDIFRQDSINYEMHFLGKRVNNFN